MEEDQVSPEVSDRALLEQISRQLEQQQADIDTIRWRTGCLYAWLVLSVIIGVVVFMASR